MIKQPTISFDLDDVLGHFHPLLLQELSDYTGIQVDIDSLTNNDVIHSHFGLDEYPRDFIIQNRILERLDVIEHAHTAMWVAKNLGYDVSVVTARAWHPSGTQITEDWLHGFPVDRLHVVGIEPGEKAKAFDQYADICCHIDDSPHFAVEAKHHRSVEMSALLHRPWNQHVTDDYHTLRRVNCHWSFICLMGERSACRNPAERLL